VTVGKLTPERRRELTREALLDAASEVFARRGYEAGTLEEIASTAGLTTGAIYSNFGGKQDLFLAVLERRNSRLTEHYTVQLAGHKSMSPLALADVAQLWTDVELSDRDALRLTLEYRLAALRDPDMRTRISDFERRTEETIADFVSARLKESADLQDPPVSIEDFAVIVHAASQGILQHVAVCGADHSNLFERFLALLTQCLLPPARALPRDPS
jgi:AcrR family transcriptional regulator